MGPLKENISRTLFRFPSALGWFGTCLVNACCNKIPQYLSKLIPGRNGAFILKSEVEVPVFKLLSIIY